MPSKASNLAGFASSISANNNLNVGIVTASGFVGNVTGNLTGNVTGNATGLSGTPNLNVGIITASSFVGNLTGNATGLSGTPNVVLGIATVGSGSTSAPSITPSGDSNTGVFFPSADTIALSSGGSERLRVDSSGNINIDSGTVYVDAVNNRLAVGTTSPSELLQVNGSARANSFLSQGYFAGQGNLSTADARSGLTGIGPSSSTAPGDFYGAYSYFYGAVHNTRPGDIEFGTGLNTSGSIQFKINATERARIDSSGRLLVGTSTARSNFFNSNYSGLFQVEGANNETGQRASLFVYGVNSSSGPILALGKHRSNSIGGSTVVASGDEAGVITFQGADGTEFVEAARISAVIDGDPGANDMPGRLVFSTTADGASSPTERMRITNAGRVGINETSPGGLFHVAPQPGYGTKIVFMPSLGDPSLYTYSNWTGAAYHLAFNNPNGLVGRIETSGTSTSFVTSSDYRLKENITVVTDGITRLQQLKPSRFNFIADPDKTVDGFIAHEVKAVVPEAISGEKDAVDDEGNPIYQGIDQSKLVPLLTAALQEAIGEIEALKARVAALESA